MLFLALIFPGDAYNLLKSRFRPTLLLVFCVVVLLLQACGNTSHEYLVSGRVMGTSYSVKLVADSEIPVAQITDLEARIGEVLTRVDELMSTYKEESELSRFNRLPAGEEMTLSPETYAVIKRSLVIMADTDGYFDPGVSDLVNLWGFGPEGMVNKVPDQEQIAAALEIIGPGAVELVESTRSVLKVRDVRFDLSAIAKGYAVDRVAQLLGGQALKGFLVEVGGEIYASGQSQRDRPWILGIERPDVIGQRAFSTVMLSGQAMATSGDYRNYFEVDGRRYSHTIDPGTGYPIKNTLASVSVIADSCADADALATALMVMGLEKGYQHAVDNGLNAYFIYRTDNGFNERFTKGFEAFIH